MSTSATARSLLAGFVLTLAAVPLHAQRVEAGVVVRSGPVAGHVVVRDGYSTYQRTRRVIERPHVVVVERVHRHRHAHHWTRHGFRRVTLYHVGGRYYDRWIGHRHGVRRVVVWERDGRYYRDECDDVRPWGD